MLWYGCGTVDSRTAASFPAICKIQIYEKASVWKFRPCKAQEKEREPLWQIYPFGGMIIFGAQ